MDEKNKSVLVLIFGILSLVGNFMIVGGIIFSVLALGFYSTINNKKKFQEATIGFWFALVGLFLNILGILAFLFFFSAFLGIPVLMGLIGAVG